MRFIAFSPAAALRFAALATAQRLTEDETCAVLHALHTAHPAGIVPVASVERAVTDVTIASTLAALNARARVPSGRESVAPVAVVAD